MERRKLSAFIPVQNVGDIIEECLDSIAWVDEIFIVDAFSTDKTVEICRRYSNVKLVQHEYINSGEQRAWGMPQVTHDWVFIIDSDERCSPGLRNAIEKILTQEQIKYDGFLVKIRTKFMGKLLKHPTYLGGGGKRLVKKELNKNYIIKRVHSKMKIDNKTWIKNKDAYLIHEPIRDFEAQWKKLIRYSVWYAEDMFDKNERTGIFQFTIRPFIKFFQYFIIRGGFRDGLHGFVLCVVASISIFMKYYKLWMMNQQAKLANTSSKNKK